MFHLHVFQSAQDSWCALTELKWHGDLRRVQSFGKHVGMMRKHVCAACDCVERHADMLESYKVVSMGLSAHEVTLYHTRDKVLACQCLFCPGNKVTEKRGNVE